MKVHIITMAYCNANVFQRGMQALNHTVDLERLNATHWVLDQHYPLDRERLLLSMASYQAAQPRANVIGRGRNLGLHEGLNYAIAEAVASAPIFVDDIIVGFDPDENPLSVGWLDAMLRVFEASPNCGWLSLMSPAARKHLDASGNYQEKVLGGVRVQVPPYDMINTVCAWRAGAIAAVGKFEEPHAYYGGLESAMMGRYRRAGYWIGWLADLYVEPLHQYADAEYSLYKQHHVGHQLPVFPGSFDEWLHVRGVVSSLKNNG